MEEDLLYRFRRIIAIMVLFFVSAGFIIGSAIIHTTYELDQFSRDALIWANIVIFIGAMVCVILLIDKRKKINDTN